MFLLRSRSLADTVDATIGANPAAPGAEFNGLIDEVSQRSLARRLFVVAHPAASAGAAPALQRRTAACVARSLSLDRVSPTSARSASSLGADDDANLG